MKTLLTLSVLFFSSLVSAEDISDFEIEGISIGESLLDYFSEKEITSWNKTFHKKSKKFYLISQPRKLMKEYEQLSFYIKNQDKNFIIYSISGVKYFDKENIKGCIDYKKNVVNDINSLFNNLTPNSYQHTYDYIEDGKSIAYVTDFKLLEGSIRVWCVDWSEITEEKRNWGDNVSVTLSFAKFLNWLNNKAN